MDETPSDRDVAFAQCEQALMRVISLDRMVSVLKPEFRLILRSWNYETSALGSRHHRVKYPPTYCLMRRQSKSDATRNFNEHYFISFALTVRQLEVFENWKLSFWLVQLGEFRGIIWTIKNRFHI